MRERGTRGSRRAGRREGPPPSLAAPSMSLLFPLMSFPKLCRDTAQPTTVKFKKNRSTWGVKPKGRTSES